MPNTTVDHLEMENLFLYSQSKVAMVHEFFLSYKEGENLYSDDAIAGICFTLRDVEDNLKSLFDLWCQQGKELSALIGRECT